MKSDNPKYLSFENEAFRKTYEILASPMMKYSPYKEFVPNPKKCKKGHQYVNDECINCGKILIAKTK